MALGGVGAIVAQAPLGALVDRTTAKRALVIGGALTITAGSLAMPLFPGFFSISVLQALTGIAGSVFAPALAAITLGVVGPRFFSRRIGRNESFNHAGNASAAALTGGLAYFFGPVVVFWVLAVMAASSVAATLRIPRAAIDHDVARGMDHLPGEPHREPSSLKVLLRQPKVDDLCGGGHCLSLRQRRHVAAGRPATGVAQQRRRDRVDGRLHRRRAGRDGAGGVPRRSEGRFLGDESRSFSSDSRCWPHADSSIRCRITRIGWSACNSWTVTEPVSSGRCFPSSCRT